MEATARANITCGIIVIALVLATAGRGSDNILSMAPVRDPTQGPEDNKTYTVPSSRHRNEAKAREKQIYFPPDPPPLGAQINFGGHAGTSLLLSPELGSHVGELFYPPLSTCLTEFNDTAYRRFRARVEAYTQTRAELLAELRTTLAGLAGASTDERLATLTALARRQDEPLKTLEAEAASLREDMSNIAGWYDRREWKLGRGVLHERLPEHAVLEFQLVRAAAFYQDGLAPGQRRLLREAAMSMQDELFNGETEGTPGIAAPALIFFSPDLARILPAENFPATVRSMLVAFEQEKDALRSAVKTKVLQVDGAVLSSTRRRAFETLAREQSPRLAALEERAEAIRREYAPTFSRHRLAPPLELPPDLARMIEEYEEGKRRFLAGLEQQRRALHSRLSRPAPGEAVSRIKSPRGGWIYPAVEELKKNYTNEHVEELTQLAKLLGEIYPLLVAAAGPDRVAPMHAGSDTFLVKFMAEHRQEHAYFEYETAVWEPGLSPAQRRLLFNGAMAKLELPVPWPERQPTKPPLTLLESQPR